MDERGIVTAVAPGDAGELLKLRGAAFVTVTRAHRDLPQVRAIGLFAGRHSRASLQRYRRHAYRQTHNTQPGATLLVHLAKGRSCRSGASYGPGCS